MEVVGLRAEVMVDAELTGEEAAVQQFATAETREKNDIIQESFPELRPQLAELLQRIQRDRVQHELKRKPRRGEPIH